jgi:hypothetical protein
MEKVEVGVDRKLQEKEIGWIVKNQKELQAP